MKCPGQDMKYWKASAIFDVQCPKCNTTVEFYKDDTSRKCSNCGHRFVNPKMDFGCAAYCPYAEQCLGALPEEFTGARDNLLKDKVAVEMKRFFQADFKGIRKAVSAAQFAENIGKEEGGNLAILLCAAYLHGTGSIQAQAILRKAGAGEPMIQEIINLLNQTDPVTESATLEAKILHDTLTLRQLQEEQKEGMENSGTDRHPSNAVFFTQSARSIAVSLGQ